MDTFRSHSRGRSQPSVRWANSRSASRSPSRGFRNTDYTADPAFVQVAPRIATRSRSRSRAGSRASSDKSSRSPSTDRYGNPSATSQRARSPSHRSSAKSWIDDTAKMRDENGKVAKSSIAILGAIGAAAYVAHRTIPKFIPGSSHSGSSDSGHSSNGNVRRSSSWEDRHDVDDRRPRRRHHGEKVERHHRYTTYYDEELAVPQPPPRPSSAYYDGGLAAPQPPPRPASAYYEHHEPRHALPARSDYAEPSWSRESNVTKTHYIDEAPAVQGVVQPGLYRDEDDNAVYVDGSGRQFVEEYRSGGRFWPGGRLP